MNIEIEYNGEYPNLCRGDLVVIIDGREWKFPQYCMSSGGSVTFDEEWNESIGVGEWDITDWPEGFPEDMKDYVLAEVNDKISWGCCGGCV